MFLAVKERLNVINKAHSSIVHVSNSSCTNDKFIAFSDEPKAGLRLLV